jgi:hypothetical protein
VYRNDEYKAGVKKSFFICYIIILFEIYCGKVLYVMQSRESLCETGFVKTYKAVNRTIAMFCTLYKTMNWFAKMVLYGVQSHESLCEEVLYGVQSHESLCEEVLYGVQCHELH